jgi:glycosyltransferase involved in cell wall biosynthesis
MRASITIPLYNQSEFVAQTISSAIGQTERDSEVIVVNDESTDNSLSIAASFGSRIVLINQKNTGLNGARNAGARVAKGEFLLFLDADDFISPNYLEKTIPLMTDGVGVVSTDMDMFGEVNRLQPIGHPTLDIQKWANTMPYCSLIRRTTFDQVGGYSPSQDVWAYGDWNMWIGILKRGWRVAPLAEPLFHYRVRPTSMRTEVEGRHREMQLAIQRHHKELYR